MKQVNQILAIAFGIALNFAVSSALLGMAAVSHVDPTMMTSFGGIVFGSFAAWHFHNRAQNDMQSRSRIDVIALIVAVGLAVQVVTRVVMNSHWTSYVMSGDYVAMLTHVAAFATVALALFHAARHLEASTKYAFMARAASVN